MFPWHVKSGVPLFGAASPYGTVIFVGNTALNSLAVHLQRYVVLPEGRGVCRVSRQAGRRMSLGWTGPGPELSGSRDGRRSLPVTFLLLERG